VVDSSEAEVIAKKHDVNVTGELEILKREFKDILQRAPIPTPIYDMLIERAINAGK